MEPRHGDTSTQYSAAEADLPVQQWPAWPFFQPFRSSGSRKLRQNGVTEMVHRLFSHLAVVDLVDAILQEDRRHADRSIGIDLGKTTRRLAALGENRKVLLRKKFTQKQLITFTANMQTSLIGMEAYAGAHSLARSFSSTRPRRQADSASVSKALGEVQQEPFMDAEAIAEAAVRENMRFVPILTDDQLDLQALHRCGRD